MENLKVKIKEELQKHIPHLRYFLEVDEIESIYKIIWHIIDTYSYKVKEYLHISKGKNNNFNKLLEKEGNENKIELSNENIQEIDNQVPLSLTFIHNHPNNSAPSYDDFFVLIIHGSVQNMIVFGIIGSLYFIQKTNPQLHFSYSGNKEKDDLKERLKDALLKTILANIGGEYPNLTHKERMEKIKCNPDKKNEIFIAALNEYFVSICEDNKFNYYPKR
jgi:hypothetical protein